MMETVTLSLERYENMVEELTDLRSFKNKRSFCVQTQSNLFGEKRLTFQIGKEASEFFNDIIVNEYKELCEENQRLKLEIKELKRKKMLDLVK